MEFYQVRRVICGLRQARSIFLKCKCAPKLSWALKQVDSDPIGLEEA